jgi:hypothetical protein
MLLHMGRIIACLVAILLAMPAHAAWLEATTKHFRVYSDGSDTETRAFATKIERFDAFLRGRYNIGDEPNPQRLTIFVLRTSAQVAKLTEKNVAGFYSASARGSIAVINRERATDKFDLSGEAVLFHEYAHHFMYRYFPFAYPLWYSEGFAEYVSTATFTKDGHAELGKVPYFRSYGLAVMPLIPARDLITSDSRGKTGGQSDAFYGQSWMLTHFLNQVPARSGQLATYLKAINSGTPNLEAAEAAFGDLNTLTKDLRAYRDRSSLTYGRSAKPTPIPGDVVLRTLPEGEGALVMHRLTIMREPDKEEAEALIAPLTSIVVKTPTAEGWRLLAEVQLIAERDQNADASADAALKLDPNLARAMLIKSEVAKRLYVKSSPADPVLAKTMRSWIVKANRANPEDPLPLIAYYEQFGLTGEKAPKIALDGLRRAFQMVPEANEVRMTYVYAMLNEQKWDQATALVKPVAFAPHGGGNAERAQQLLDRIAKAKAGDKDALESLR